MNFSLESLPAPIIVFAPHPDDETLGCGGLIATACELGIPVGVVFVTDGGASHPGSSAWSRQAIAQIRKSEAQKALDALGAGSCPRWFLELPDGAMPGVGSACHAQTIDRIRAIFDKICPGTLVLPWRRDPHADHRATWSLAKDAAAGRSMSFTVLEYPIWLAENGTADDRPRESEVDQIALDIKMVRPLKEAAIAAHRSQLGLLIDDDPGGFALSHETLRRLLTDVEPFWMSRW